MLIQDKDDPACWSDEAHKGPATFAVVIGVSQYLHLDGKPTSFGLNQLAVSALTAYRFFAWLKDEYKHVGMPLAKCWLLLSPTPAEIAVEPALAGIKTPPATMEKCRAAIEAWFRAMSSPNLDSVHAESSRAIFFFSGHGLAVTDDRQILLPSDYLERPLRNVNNALSTYNLYAGLRGLPIPERFFFMDACRNDHPELRELALQGSPILTEWPSYKTIADITAAPIVYATGPGTAAWQPSNPADGSSVFGRALVDGLKCLPNMVAVNEGGRSWVTMTKLQAFLKERVKELLQSSGTKVSARVMFGGFFDEAQLCEVAPPPPPAASPTPVDDADFSMEFGADAEEDVGYSESPGGGGGGAPGMDGGGGGGWGGGGGRPIRPRRAEITRPKAAPPTRPAPPPTAAPPPSVEDVFEPVPLPAAWPPPAASATQIWTVIKNEFLSSLLAHAKVHDLATRQWHPFEDQGTLKIDKVARNPQRPEYRIDVRIKPRRTIWLELNDPLADTRASCILRGDEYTDTVYTVEVDMGEENGLGVINDLDVVLSRDNTGLLGEAAELWDRYRTADIKRATAPQEMSLLEKALHDKMQSPLTATVAALLLLRAWRHDLMHNWTKNLADRFPDLPDACVVWTEQMLRTDHSDTPKDVLPWLLQLEERGVPFTSEGLSIATRQAGEMLRFAFESKTEKKEPDCKRVGWVQERLNNALKCFRPGGLALTFIGPKKRVVPALMNIGTRPKKATPKPAVRERPPAQGAAG